MTSENLNDCGEQIPAQKENCCLSGVSLWVKAAAMLFGLSVVLAGLIIVRQPKIAPSEEMPDGVAGLIKSQSGVGWVHLRGIISESMTSAAPWERGAGQFVKKLKSLAERREVKAIVIDINSPGGSAAASQEIYSQIMQIRAEKKKPIIALMRDVAASGGYYVASACDKIVANPSTLTGSIGVIFQTGNVEGLFKKVGLKTETIKSGRYKDIGSMYRAMGEDERKMLQALIDDTMGQFYEAVKKGRNLTDEELKPIADGRIFTGRQALSLKLIDKLGGADTALAMAGEMTGLGKNPKIIKDTERWEYLFSVIDSKLSGGILGMGGKIEEFSSPKLMYLWGY
ncbi:MAG: signal peptide peptidase SppA [Elusimicrobia bacterium]|nr:signal peptide peptidase SppA [Elusimicrobiota bacterium]